MANYSRYWALGVIKRAEDKSPRGYEILYNYFGYSRKELVGLLATGSKQWPLVRSMAQFMHTEFEKHPMVRNRRAIAEKACQQGRFGRQDWLVFRLDSFELPYEAEFAPK